MTEEQQHVCTISERITDIAAIIILFAGIWHSINTIAMPEFFNMAFGAAITYLFVKHSPNTQ